MRPVPRLRRALALVVVAGYLSSCATTPRSQAVPHPPLLSSVVRGRFVTQVELDDGNLVVQPPGKLRPRVAAARAQALFRAADVVDGAYRFAVLGLGLATVSPDVPTTTGSSTTTTPSGPAPAGGGASTTTTHPTTTTMTTVATSSTASTSSTTLSVAPPTTVPPLPRYDHRLAWVGIAWGVDCPGAAGGSSSSTRYVAFVLDARTGHSAIAYTGRGPGSCGGPVLAPAVSRPDELVSVPWQPVGPTSTAVRVTVPACGSYFGWTEVPGPGAGSIQVVARVPFDPVCGTTAASTPVADNVVPLGAPQAQVAHAVLGSVDGLRTLPGG